MRHCNAEFLLHNAAVVATLNGIPALAALRRAGSLLGRRRRIADRSGAARVPARGRRRAGVVVAARGRLAGHGADGGFGACVRCGDPASQAVGDVRGVAVGCNAGAEVAAGRDRARVVDARRLVVHAHVRGAGLGEVLLQPVAAAGAGRTVADHLCDGGGGAWVLHAVLVAGGGAVVVLHQAGVAHAPVGCGGADAAVRFLHHNSENEAGVDAGFASNGLDAIADIVDFGGGVIGNGPLGAGRLHDKFVVVEPA